MVQKLSNSSNSSTGHLDNKDQMTRPRMVKEIMISSIINNHSKTFNVGQHLKEIKKTKKIKKKNLLTRTNLEDSFFPPFITPQYLPLKIIPHHYSLIRH